MRHLAAAGLLINLQRRGLFEVVPDKVRNRWKEWQPRVLVISSLALQIALILSGKRRKYSGIIWFRFFVWSTYLLADWVATLALGVIANNLEETHGSTPPNQEDILMWFWAPFLLVHLGGPDTITAYSMEDNELWQRRSLELITQTLASLYIFLIVWPKITPLTALTLPMLVVGVVKFGERIGALRSASDEHFRDSLLTPPDPGPNYAKFMEDFTLKKAEGFYVKADVIIEASAPANAPADAEADDESKLIVKGYNQFQRFKRLFVDLILSFQDRDESQSFFSELKSEIAFHVIEVELGFIYDVLYTKAPVVYSKLGCFLRLFTMLLTSLVLILFPFISKGKNYKTVDLVITYLLMVGAIVLEMGGLLFLLYSDWTRYWLSKQDGKNYKFLLRFISWRKPKRRWSTSMAQYSLLNECLKEEPTGFSVIKKILTVNKAVESHMALIRNGVSPDLKDLIFKHCLEISKEIKNSEHLMKLCRSRGDYALGKSKHIELDWSTTNVEFDQSILLWHIATELCYYSDKDVINKSKECIESKHISDYMLYLLAMCPFMLPVGIGLIRFRDTCAEATEFFKNKTSVSKDMACRMLLRVNTEVLPSQVKGDRSKSVLFDACRLATSLRAMDRDSKDPTASHQQRKWEIISKVWVEILGYAAIHCRGTQHAQQLRKGGELLTHVWLLMAHLGITEQLQISQGHARAKLNVK
ncbi:hypothetical protein V2J09_017905 [Rumex salicifolius]